MGIQSKAFLDGEGEAWLARNRAKLPVKDDPVLDTLKRFPAVKPTSILEIGCADGWRLRHLTKSYDCEVYGIDPAASNKFYIEQGTAADLSSFGDERIDLVIYGFCLYLCDREDLFKIVAEGDRVLKDGGHLLIYDFASPPACQEYRHKPGLLSYKMDYSKLWLGNPAYSLFTRQYYGTGTDTTSVVILEKNMEAGWPKK